MTVRIPIKEDLLTWAIRRAGFVVEDFKGKHPKVGAWLAGDRQPTLKQLEQFSKQVHVPFGYLLLDTPPEEEQIIPFFRTGHREPVYDVPLAVRDTVAQLQLRQEWLVEYLKNQGQEALPFVGRFPDGAPVNVFAEDMRNELQLASGWAKELPSWQLALRHLIGRVEEAGIVVTINGVVGNNTRRPILVEDCRGFVLIDPIAPFLFLNNRDAKSAQMFTLAHELAHVWIGESVGFNLKQLLPADHPIEKLCNEVAAEFLVAGDELRQAWRENHNPEQLARQFKVSPIVVARRALELQLWDKPQFFEFYNRYLTQRKEKKESSAGGGNFYNTAPYRISPRFLGYVDTALREGRVSYTDAYRLTNLKRGTYETLVEQKLKGGG